MWQAYFDACHLHDLCKKQNHGFVNFTKVSAFD